MMRTLPALLVGILILFASIPGEEHAGDEATQAEGKDGKKDVARSSFEAPPDSLWALAMRENIDWKDAPPGSLLARAMRENIVDTDWATARKPVHLDLGVDPDGSCINSLVRRTTVLSGNEGTIVSVRIVGSQERSDEPCRFIMAHQKYQGA